MSVAIYASGHGYGHAVRCAEVARALLARGARVLVRSQAPRWLFPRQVEELSSTPSILDVGVVQRDGLEMDLDETRRQWRAFAQAQAARVSEEAEALAAAGVDVVVGDIPPLAFAAAARAGVPSAALGNFGWDWIYAAWPGFEDAVRQVQEGYRQAGLLLRLPLHSREPDAFTAFQRIEEIPLIARRARRSRAAIRTTLGLPLNGRVVLVSFGGHDISALDVAALAAWPAYTFVLTPSGECGGMAGANVRLLPPRQLHYPSLLAACDAIVTKPGYGIVADSLVNRVPVLYTERGPFREYDVLVQALETLGHAAFVPQSDVRRGYLGPHLDALLERRAAWQPLRADGAAAAADRLLALAWGVERTASPG